jgi:hypothetical protein
MPKIVLIVREPGRLKPDYSLDMDVPEIPRVGDYVSVQRPDNPRPWGEDMIVRAIWWRLDYPGTGTASQKNEVGKVNEIFVECEMATGPYSSDHWFDYANARRSAGDNIPEFDVSRVSFRQRETKPKE